MRMRKKKNLIPRMERCGDRLIREPYSMPGKWRELMPQARELRLELGCGKGRFTAGTAAAEPDVLFIAVERVPDAMVMAMERCAAQGLTNVFFIDANADQLPLFFAPGEADRIYINFCDPWPSNRHAKRRLTHGNFLRLYRQVLKMGGQIHFKTDNQDLFTFSVEELPLFGFELSEVTRDLHANGPVGVMTDYEAKFHEQGLPICRCVATMVPWEEPFPTDIRRVKNRWLDVFADGVSDAELGRHVLSDGNYLWHLFSWNLVPCLSGDAARQALSEASGEKYLFYYEEPPEGEPLVRPVTAEELVTLPADARAIPGADWYVVDKDFTAELLAEELGADCLMILTAVEKVAVHFGKPEQKWLDRLTPAEALVYAEEGQFAPGSMLPKVQAAVKFAQSKPGRAALITLLERAIDGIRGKTGTLISM